MEGNSYGPLTHFLNIIVRAAKERLTPWAARHLRDLRFLPHGVEMQDKVDLEKTLIPDALGLVRSPPPRQQKISDVLLTSIIMASGHNRPSQEQAT